MSKQCVPVYLLFTGFPLKCSNLNPLKGYDKKTVGIHKIREWLNSLIHLSANTPLGNNTDFPDGAKLHKIWTKFTMGIREGQTYLFT